VTTRAEFRLLVLFNALLIPVAMFVSALDVRLLPPEQQAWLASRAAPASALHSLAGMLSFGAFIAMCIGLAGLLAFQRWARSLVLVATIAIYLPMPLSGTVVLSGFAYTMDSVAAILWGVLLAVAYWSPVAALFDARTRRAAGAGQAAGTV
jgi:hypothetical protein